MQEQNKTIWKMPPRGPIPRRDEPEHGPEHPERQSEGTTDKRNKSDSQRRNSKRPSRDN
jgi:hypothetical protein